MKKKLAVIFDMDGVLVDNYAYHRKAWELFCSKYSLDLNLAFRSMVFGGTNRFHLETFFSRKLSQQEVQAYETEKESLYRSLYAEHIRPVNGLVGFLKLLQEASVPIALATSSPSINVEFVLSGTQTASFFKIILDASDVTHGKPDPEIYLKAALALQKHPAECVVIEDSVNGIISARAAGTKIVALTTTHTRLELPEVDLVVEDFEGLDVKTLEKLF